MPVRSLFAPIQGRQALVDGGESLVDFSCGIAPEHALPGEQPRQFVEALTGALAKRLEFLAVIGEFLTELAEQAKRVTFGFSHVESQGREAQDKTDAGQDKG